MSPARKASSVEVESAARSLNSRIIISEASTEGELDTAFVRLAEQQVHAVLITFDPFFYDRGNKVAVLSAWHALPAVFELREFAETGGLISYATSYNDAHRQAG